MNVRQVILAFALTVSLIATLGAKAAHDLVPARSHVADRALLKPSVSDDFLASRLNVSNVAKTVFQR